MRYYEDRACEQARHDFERAERIVDAWDAAQVRYAAQSARLAALERERTELLALVDEVNECGVGPSNRYWYHEHAMLCASKSTGTERGSPCDCGLDEWERRARAALTAAKEGP